MRMRKKPWADLELTQNPHVIQDGAERKGKWAEFFQNERPIYLEIGCGKGNFIRKNAMTYPDINFIGMERQSSVIAIAARKVAEDLPNLALVCDNAEKLSDFFTSGEVSRLYINFCDPWPKTRYAKRRLTHRNFLRSYLPLFQHKAEIFFKTDNSKLFEFSINEFLEDGWQVSNVSLDLHHSQYQDNIMTEYEEKFSAKGMPIYRLEARKQL